MHDAPKTGSLRFDALLDELSQLRIANAEREQELSCLKALHQLSPREEVLVDDQLRLMIDLVPHGFLSPRRERSSPDFRVRVLNPRVSKCSGIAFNAYLFGRADGRRTARAGTRTNSGSFADTFGKAALLVARRRL